MGFTLTNGLVFTVIKASPTTQNIRRKNTAKLVACTTFRSIAVVCIIGVSDITELGFRYNKLDNSFRSVTCWHLLSSRVVRPNFPNYHIPK